MKELLEAVVAEMLEQKVLLEDALEELEKRFILTALARSRGNQCKAAALLRVHRNTLARKIVQYKIKGRR
jgi:DNA-binding NtrC family response regulator